MPTFISPTVSTRVFTAHKAYEVFTHPNTDRLVNVIDDAGHLRSVLVAAIGGGRCPHLLQYPERNIIHRCGTRDAYLAILEDDRTAWRNAGHWVPVDVDAYLATEK